MISAVAVLVAAASACHHAPPPGVTTLTSVPISYEADASASRASTPSAPSTTGAPSAAAAPSLCVPAGAEAPLVSPGLDNTVTGGVANTGVPLNYPNPR